MNSSPTRVPLIAPGTRPELAQLEAQILQERGQISPLYQTLLNSPAVASGWRALLTAIRLHTRVPADLRELAILRVAVLNHAAFEFDAHLSHAAAAGVNAEKITAVRDTTPSAPFNALERLVLALTDRMTRDVAVPDALLDQIKAHFDAQTTVELVATIAAYNMVSRFLVALNVGH